MKSLKKMIPGLVLVLVALGLTLGAVGCEEKKEEEKTEKSAEEAEGEGAESEGEGAEGEGAEGEAEGDEGTADGDEGAAAEGEGDEASADAGGEYIKFNIMHTEEAKGPVDGSFGEFELKEAKIDMENLGESMAVYEVDLSSIETGNPKRDEHLRSGDFFGVDKYPTATFTIKDIQPADDSGMHSATAELAIRGLKKEVPVQFKIAEQNEDGSVVVEGKAELSRQELTVGGAPEEAGAKDPVTLSVRLNVAPTGA